MKNSLKVELIAHTPNPEGVIAAAAKLCYSPVGISDILKGQEPESVKKFLNHLMSLGHESPIEHVSFTFGIEGVSRILETQLVRHRLASYSIQSGRYVKRDKPDFVTPPMIADHPEASEIYQEALEVTMKAYHDLIDVLMKDQVKAYCQQKGLPTDSVNLETFYELHKKDYKKFEKIAIENARYVYPQSLCTKIVVTMNARTLMNFFKHRTCRRAQDEIQALAWLMVDEIKKVAPTLANYMGPSCLTTGRCSEGAMCCGKPYKK